MRISARFMVVGLLAWTAGTAPVWAAKQAQELRFRDLVVGETHTCGLTAEGLAYCWGDNRYGQLGIDNTKRQTRPTPVAGGHHFAALVAAGTDTDGGGYYTCGLTLSGQGLCWGDNRYGQLGDGSTERREVPTPLARNPRLMSLHAHGFETCGVEASGKLLCWGMLGQEPMGARQYQIAEQPGAVPGPDDLDAGGFQPMYTPTGNCIRAKDGALYCWRLMGNRFSTAAVTPESLRLRMVTLGTGLANPCGLTDVGELHCWTVIWSGMGVMQTPATALAPGMKWQALAGSGSALWALDDAGRLHRLQGGSKALGRFEGQAPEVLLPDQRFTALAVHPRHQVRCALGVDGDAWCWGATGSGATGTGRTEADLSEPTPVVGAQRFTKLWTRNRGACALSAEGQAYCWGSNDSGEVGDGSRKDRAVPTPVAAPKS